MPGTWLITPSPVPDYDSGFVAVPATLTVLTALTIYPIKIGACNTNAEPRKFTVVDTAGAQICDEIELAGKSVMVPLELFPKKVVGIQWRGDFTGIVGWVVGYKDL